MVRSLPCASMGIGETRSDRGHLPRREWPAAGLSSLVAGCESFAPCLVLINFSPVRHETRRHPARVSSRQAFGCRCGNLCYGLSLIVKILPGPTKSDRPGTA